MNRAHNLLMLQAMTNVTQQTTTAKKGMLQILPEELVLIPLLCLHDSFVVQIFCFQKDLTKGITKIKSVLGIHATNLLLYSC